MIVDEFVWWNTAAKGFLKNCPCCDSEAILIKEVERLKNGTEDSLFRVQCIHLECGISTKSWNSIETAIKTWHRRSDGNSPN